MCAHNRSSLDPVDRCKQFFSLTELNQLVQQENSCVSVVTSKRCISLMPLHLKNLFASIKELLSAKVSKYDVQLEGVILAHKNIKLIASSFKLGDCRSFPLEYVADIYLFKPKVGSRLTGVVNKITSEYINILVHRTFNVTVYSNGRRWTLVKGSQVEVEVVALDYTSQLPYIKASMISPGYVEADTGDAPVAAKRKKKSKDYYNDQTSLIGISQREEQSSLIGISQRKELVSILKNSPLRVRQSSTEMESQEAESSSTESSKAKAKDVPSVGQEEPPKHKKKKKKEKKAKCDDVNDGGKSSRKRKREDDVSELVSSSKKSKKDKHKDKTLEKTQATPNATMDTTAQTLPNDSIFEAACSTPVLGPPSPKKKRKPQKMEDSKQSALIESLLQLKMEEIMAPRDEPLASSKKDKAKSKKAKIKVEQDVALANQPNDDGSSVGTESESSSGKKKKKKKKEHKRKSAEHSAMLSQVLKRIKEEV